MPRVFAEGLPQLLDFLSDCAKYKIYKCWLHQECLPLLLHSKSVLKQHGNFCMTTGCSLDGRTCQSGKEQESNIHQPRPLHRNGTAEKGTKHIPSRTFSLLIIHQRSKGFTFTSFTIKIHYGTLVATAFNSHLPRRLPCRFEFVPMPWPTFLQNICITSRVAPMMRKQ